MLSKNLTYLFAAFFMWFASLSARAADLPDFTTLVEQQGAAVVNISTTQRVKASGMDFPGFPPIPQGDPMFDFFRHFMQPQTGPKTYESHSLGSGFIVSSDGVILTNAHVVDDATDITVRLNDKREFKAKVIGTDPRSDVAVLKINATNLPKVTIGDPSKLKVGEWVVAIGSPFGFDHSVTAGIVSAKGRSLPQDNYVPFIQTDVPINPGNSGGPLFNMKGEVVGINSQIYSRTGGFMGLSFSIPINVAMDVSDQLRTTGKVTRGWLGISIQEVSRGLAESFGLSKPVGALIASVAPGSPADKSGLHASDVILKMGGKAIEDTTDLVRITASLKPGSRIPVEIWRDGKPQTVSVLIGEAPKQLAQDDSGSAAAPAPQAGLAVVDLTAEQKRQLGISSGVMIQDLTDEAAESGLQQGDIIMAVNSHSVSNTTQFRQLMQQFASRKSVALLVRRGDSTLYLPFKLTKK